MAQQLRGFSLKLEGTRELRAALTDLSEQGQEIVRSAIREGSAVVQSEAVRRVPKRSGALAASIHTTIRADGAQATIGSQSHYAAFVEFGTKHNRAKPWLYPAFKRGARVVRKIVREGAADLGKVRFRSKRLKRKAAA